MELSELVASPVPEIILTLGGLLALMIGLVGESDKTHIDELLILIAVFVGIVMIVFSVLIYLYSDFPMSTVYVSAFLGLSLFSRMLKRIRWATVVSIAAASLIGYGLYQLGQVYSLSFLTADTALVIALVVFLVLYLVLKALETTIRLTAALLSFRPVLLAVGILAIAEAVLLFTGNSLSSVFGG